MPTSGLDLAWLWQVLQGVGFQQPLDAPRHGTPCLFGRNSAYWLNEPHVAAQQAGHRHASWGCPCKKSHLDDWRLLGDGLEIIVEHPQPNDVQPQAQEHLLHVRLPLETHHSQSQRCSTYARQSHSKKYIYILALKPGNELDFFAE